MLVQVLVLSLPLFGLSYAAVSCNSVALTDSANPDANSIESAFPINVCITREMKLSSIEESRKFVCDSNGVATMQVYDNLDCSGASTVRDVCYDWGLTECEATYICDSVPCSYIFMEVWQGVTQCDGDSAAVYDNYTAIPVASTLFDGTCQVMDTLNNTMSMGLLVSCPNGDLGFSYYANISCEGDPIFETPFLETECDLANGTATAVTCDLVAPDTSATEPPLIVTTDDRDSSDYDSNNADSSDDSSGDDGNTEDNVSNEDVSNDDTSDNTESDTDADSSNGDDTADNMSDESSLSSSDASSDDDSKADEVIGNAEAGDNSRTRTTDKTGMALGESIAITAAAVLIGIVSVCVCYYGTKHKRPYNAVEEEDECHVDVNVDHEMTAITVH